MAKLFEPFQVKNLMLKNRLVMAPMCLFCAGEDGIATAFHVQHYASRAVGGVGLIVVEATGVESRGRISSADLGLYTEAQVEAHRQLVSSVHQMGGKVAVQLGHAGAKCGVEGAYPVLASIGSFEDRKGQIILLQAMQKLINSGRMPDVHALFVGEGPDEEMLKAVVKIYGLENNVSFFPFTKEPNFVFDSIDILTLPSLYKEGLPNVILEAMSMGLPVISSRMTGVPEVVIEGETGFMTDIGNVEQVADAIEKLSADKELMKQMGINARQMMKDKFDKKHQFDAFLNYFESILS